MRIIHLADLHLRRDNYDAAAASIRTVVSDVKANGADLIAIAGDIWDGPVQNTAGARFADFLALIQELADLAPVAMIYGTPTHDTEGSLDVFEVVEANHMITVLLPGRAYGLGKVAGTLYDLSAEEPPEPVQMIVFGVPEPNKRWLLANGDAVGKDASDEAVHASMRGLFLGLGALRKQYAELPCVLLYHGQVVGAKSSTGYTAGSGIAVSRDDLAMVGFDYGALGDIHEPQQIPGLPAYYPGSIFPANWGETHKAGCNVVEMRPATPGEIEYDPSVKAWVEVSRLDFPHAQQAKISLDFADIEQDLDANEYVGRLAWLEITGTREDISDFDTDKMLSCMIHDGALPGSRVTLNILPTETVRAAEIAEKKSLPDKLVVWGESSNTPIGDSVIQKARDLERDAAARGVTGNGAHIRINRLILRGAVGLWKNQRKDEIDLDLDSYGPGVIAIVGSNGAGKTTILENLHPWPQMLTRDGALKDHFRLKDSCRDLYFTDERDGSKYRALISIRADIASGGIECWLYRDTGSGFEPCPGINGRQDPYIEAVGALFGSLEMYLRTAFQTQGPTTIAPDLARTTKGQRKALFAELSGIDYLDGYRADAKGRADVIEAELVRINAVIDAAADVDSLIERLMAEAGDQDLHATGEDARAKVFLDRGNLLKAERETISGRVAELTRKEARLLDIRREIGELTAAIITADRSIESFRVASSGKAVAEESLARIVALETEREALRAAKAKIDEENGRQLSEHAKRVAASDAQRRGMQTRLDEARRDAAAKNQALAVARSKLAAPIADHCPTCAQLLPEEKRAHLQEERTKLEAEIVRLESEAKNAGAVVGLAESALSQLIPPTPPEPTPFPGESRLQLISDELAFEPASADELRAVIRKADEAAVRIESAEKDKAAASGKVAALEAEKVELDGSIAVDTSRADLSAKDAELEAVRADYTSATSAAAAARASAESARRSIAEAEKRRSARKAAEAERGTKGDELADWRLLERATGADGIQALELDALAPSIAAVANRLLAVQNQRYSVEFRTTRIAGKGGKTKQIETFEIFVIDSETGSEQEIGTLSGGEGIWIKQSIMNAFAEIRARNIGVKFLTVAQDEADGALDPEARMNYLRMLEAAHTESGGYQTLLITHSSEIQAMVQQTIRVEELNARDRLDEGIRRAS